MLLAAYVTGQVFNEMLDLYQVQVLYQGTVWPVKNWGPNQLLLVG